MKQELIIHMGMHKTGSSSIQKFLAGNQSVLQKYGYMYADYNGSFSSGRMKESEKYINGMMYTFLHGKIGKGNVFEKRKWEDFLRRVEDDLSKSNVILSDEMIFANTAGKEYVACLKKRFREYGVRCVIYLRRQDMHIESQKAQNIEDYNFINKSASIMSMGDYYCYCLNHKVYEYYKYYTYLKAFEEIVGKENMAVYTYEDACEYGLCRHFAEHIVRACYGEFQEIKRVNVSASPMDIEVKKKLNNSFWQYPDRIKKTVNRLYGEMRLTYCNGKTSQLSPKDRRKILDFYEDENKAVAERYLNRANLFSGKIDYPYAEVDESEVSENYQNLLERMIVKLVNEYMYSPVRHILERGKQIVLFGAGGMCQRVVHGQKIPIEFIIDNDIEKDGIQMGGG